MHTVAFCEIDPYCRAVLRKHWPDVPCFEDIRGLDADRLAGLGRIDLICGGFPCQPWSVAGQRKGKDDDRDLWHEMFRVIEQVRPAWVIGENVTGLVGLALDDVLADLESVGYTARPFVIPAAAVGAPHRRDRLWIIATNTDSPARRRVEPERRSHRRDANASGAGEEGNVGTVADANCDSVWDNEQRQARRRDDLQNGRQAEPGYDGEARTSADASMLFGPAIERNESNGTVRGDEALADTSSARLQISECPPLPGARRWPSRRAATECDWWSTEPDVGRVAHGIPSRVDRLRSLGNAVVPQIPEVIGRAIMSIESARTER